MKLADTNSEVSRYSPYGVPTSFPRGDYDLDGDVDGADTTALGNFIAGGSYGWNLDFNGDGNVDSGDTDEHAAYVTGYDKGLGGRTVLSRSGVRNRAGYAGYEFEPALPNSAWHVRNRVLVSELGRWNRRDPAGYMDGPDLYSYVLDSPLLLVDAMGLNWQTCCSAKPYLPCDVAGCRAYSMPAHNPGLPAPDAPPACGDQVSPTFFDRTSTVSEIMSRTESSSFSRSVEPCNGCNVVAPPTDAPSRCSDVCAPQACHHVSCVRVCVLCVCATFCKYYCGPVRCTNIGSGGCTGTPPTKRCSYYCDNGSSATLYLPCTWRCDDPPCPPNVNR